MRRVYCLNYEASIVWADTRSQRKPFPCDNISNFCLSNPMATTIFIYRMCPRKKSGLAFGNLQKSSLIVIKSNEQFYILCVCCVVIYSCEQ